MVSAPGSVGIVGIGVLKMIDHDVVVLVVVARRWWCVMLSWISSKCWVVTVQHSAVVLRCSCVCSLSQAAGVSS